MKIKELINKKNTGKAKRMAIGGAVISPLAIPTLNAIETQILLHSASKVAFGNMASVGLGMGVSTMLIPVGIGIGILATMGAIVVSMQEDKKC